MLFVCIASCSTGRYVEHKVDWSTSYSKWWKWVNLPWSLLPLIIHDEVVDLESCLHCIYSMCTRLDLWPSCILNAWLMVLDPMVPLPWCFEVIWSGTVRTYPWETLSFLYPMLCCSMVSQHTSGRHSPIHGRQCLLLAGSSSLWPASHWCIP